MNQILFTNENEIQKIKKNKSKKFKLLLYSSLLLIFFLLSFYLYKDILSDKKENMSYTILNSYNIERLYSGNNNPQTSIVLNNGQKFLVIGNIEIPKVNMNYPILSNTNDELLKISPCRFYGPYPNETGNLCIAAHNYDDNRFFGNLYKLDIGDEIRIYDSKNEMIKYYIYDKYETEKNNISCTSQDTNGKKEVTLVTCNNLNGNRLIIKAKE